MLRVIIRLKTTIVNSLQVPSFGKSHFEISLCKYIQLQRGLQAGRTAVTFDDLLLNTYEIHTYLNK